MDELKDFGSLTSHNKEYTENKRNQRGHEVKKQKGL